MEFETNLGYMKLCRPIFTKTKEISKQMKESDMAGQPIIPALWRPKQEDCCQPEILLNSQGVKISRKHHPQRCLNNQELVSPLAKSAQQLTSLMH